MMFPSVAPTVALYSKLKHTRALGAPLLFASGYLLVWSAVGLLAYLLARLGAQLFGDMLAWDRAGRWAAGGILLLAGLYELTPFKDICLRRCRTPLGFLLGNWRDGPSGAVRMGARHGAWCVGCCWALMASLFALGVMSVVWMAVVAGLVAFEKLIPSRRAATYGSTMVLLVLGILVLLVPGLLPALTIPGAGQMSPMNP
jgi:predicted metal-binding membrane protein